MLKQTFLALGIVSIASGALAADITSPFSLPGKNSVLSTTSYQFSKNQAKSRYLDTNAKGYNNFLSQELKYGVTDTFSVFVSGANTWEKWKYNTGFSDDEERNLSWNVGANWNIIDSDAKLQATVVYRQAENAVEDGAYKAFQGEVKTGYQFGRFLPYVSAGINVPVGQKAEDNKLAYRGRAGLYQTICGRLALDTGVSLNYDENKEARTWDVDAELSYYLSPKSALSVYGNYTFASQAENHTSIYNKGLGARLRILF